VSFDCAKANAGAIAQTTTSNFFHIKYYFLG
jgi:hypothetical protein